jgi:hypothetical protein
MRFAGYVIEVLDQPGLEQTFLRLLSRGSSRRTDHHANRARKMTAWPASRDLPGK